MSDKSLRDWVKMGKKSLDRIKNQIQYAKNNNLKARPERGNFDESYIQDLKHSKIIHEKALKILIDMLFLWQMKFLMENLSAIN